MPSSTVAPRVALHATALLSIAAALGVLSCAGDGPTGPPAPPRVASIEVSPGGDTLVAIGRTRTFVAVARDAGGSAITGATIRWRSSDTLVARVDSVSGVVTAVANGGATITARSGTVTGTGTVSVIQFVANVSVTPGGTTALAAIGATQAFTAVARDSAGAVVAGVRFLWVSTDPAVATVDTNGVARATGPGTATISATGRGVPAYAALTVTQAPSSVQFVVEPADTKAGSAFSTALQVEVRDAGGWLVRDSRAAISLTLASPTPGAAAFGATTVNAVGGIATFSNVWIDRSGKSNTLVATSAGLGVDTSATFTVGAGAPETIDVSGAWVYFPMSSGRAIPFIDLTFRDAFGNLADTVPTADVQAFSTTGEPYPSQHGTPTRPLPGTLRFTDLSVDRPAPWVSLRASATFAGRTIVGASEAFPVSLGFYSLAMGVGYTCGTTAGASHCWGLNQALQLGRITPTIADPIPAGASDRTAYVELAAGDGETCGRRNDGGVACWGGAAGTQHVLVPGTGPGGVQFVQLARSTTHTCGMTAAGAVHCWGAGTSGQLGDGNASDSPTPVLVAGSGVGARIFRMIAVGHRYTCGLTEVGTAYCWGLNGSGQLGDSTLVTRTTPTLVAGSGTGVRTFETIWAGPGETTCATGPNFFTYCWGRVLGAVAGTTSVVPVETAVGGAARRVAIGTDHACATLLGDQLGCWGSNDYGQLGNGTTTSSAAPVLVDLGEIGAGAAWTGSRSTCVLSGQLVRCWGDNSSGQLGLGPVAPVRVTRPTRVVQ